MILFAVVVCVGSVAILVAADAHPMTTLMVAGGLVVVAFWAAWREWRESRGG